jgi:hypothetical protein
MDGEPKFGCVDFGLGLRVKAHLWMTAKGGLGDGTGRLENRIGRRLLAVEQVFVVVGWALQHG